MTLLVPSYPSKTYPITGDPLPESQVGDQLLITTSTPAVTRPFGLSQGVKRYQYSVNFSNMLDAALVGVSGVQGIVGAVDKGIQLFNFALAEAAATLGRFVNASTAPSAAIIKTVSEILETASWGTTGDDGDPTPDTQAIEHAVVWVDGLYRQVINSGYTWIKPNVTVGSGGRLVLEWWMGTKSLGVYISGDDAFYVRDWGEDVETEMQDGDAEPLDTRRSLWAWLAE